MKKLLFLGALLLSTVCMNAQTSEYYQEAANPIAILRLVVADPENLRGRETRQRRIRRDLDEALAADALRDFLAFLARALVAPYDGRADDLVLLVEHDEAMHLPREADALDVLRRNT